MQIPGILVSLLSQVLSRNFTLLLPPIANEDREHNGKGDQIQEGWTVYFSPQTRNEI